MKIPCTILLAMLLQAPTSGFASDHTIRAFHEVDDTFFRSGRLEAADFDTLDDLGVKAILTLEMDGSRDAAIRAERRSAEEHGINFLRVPMHGENKPTLAQIDAALAMITDPDNQPILVHCFHGKDRTGIIAAAYRIRHQGWTVEAARDELRALGHFEPLYWWDDILEEVE